MSIFSRFLPKRKPPELKNNIPKEKENIRKTFAVYCAKHHKPKNGKLCPACTALLATASRSRSVTAATVRASVRRRRRISSRS